jgi:hypothetical protein
MFPRRKLVNLTSMTNAVRQSKSTASPSYLAYPMALGRETNSDYYLLARHHYKVSMSCSD